jgi:hypothetical protein
MTTEEQRTIDAAMRHGPSLTLGSVQGRSEGIDEIVKLRQAVCFFANVIKSGEPWTADCEKTLRAVLGGPGELAIDG